MIKDINIKFCLNTIPPLGGKISDSFEPYLKPYVDKERAELMETLHERINKDSEDK